jgi:hypothetical protein
VALWGVIIVLIVASALFLLFRARARPVPRSRAERAAVARAELVRLSGDERVADRLAEGELKRQPDADMLTCYENALLRLKRHRGR